MKHYLSFYFTTFYSMKKSNISFVLLFLISLSILYLGVHSKVLIIFKNDCDEPVWPLAKSNGGTIPWLLSTAGGFVVQPGESKNFSVPPSWSGSIWGRTRCRMEDSGDFHCLIGDCGSDKIVCGGVSDLLQPASTTIAAFTLNATDGMDYYEVSFKNGYNLPITVAPVDSGSGGVDEHNCATAGCALNLTSSCPQELRYSDESLGCKSACQALEEPSFCCSNRFTDFFKEACPKANSFANENTSTFSCPSFGHDFHINFCPPSSTTRSTSPDKWPTEPMESDSQTKIKNNSKKWSKYKIAALISGALLTATLSIAVSCRFRDVHCCNVQTNTMFRL